MQNKYKLPEDVRGSILYMLRGLERRRREMREAERNICSLNGSARTRATVDGGDVYVFLPSAHAGGASAVESKADELAKLHESFDYKFITAVESADRQVRCAMEAAGFPASLRDKVVSQLYNSFKPGRQFNYYHTDLDVCGISQPKFYRLRNEFLRHIAKELEML